MEWYDQHARKLPWRDTRDSYRIWISEIILQQTRVDQGLPYYKRFIEAFPDVFALAEAGEDKVLRLWQGLGYYSRARNLQAAARILVKKFNGRLPDRYEELIKLPGIGEYTASAIVSIAFDQPAPVLDGNAIRVYARLFGLGFLPATVPQKEQYRKRALEIMAPGRPGSYNQAIMELGARICLPRNPACGKCPLFPACYARKYGKQEELPPSRPRPVIKKRRLSYLLVVRDQHILLKRRTARDVWQGLFEFPLVESGPKNTLNELTRKFGQLALDFPMGVQLKNLKEDTRHRLTHQELQISFHELLSDCHLKNGSEYKWVPLDKLGEYAFPRPLLSFLHKRNIFHSY